MALNVPNLFPATQGQPVVNYDFVDIANQTGYVNYYGGRTKTSSGGVVFKLSPYKFYSDRVGTSAAFSAVNNVWNFMSSLAFRVQFIVPQFIGGKTVVNIPIGAECTGTNGARVVAVASVFKEDSAGNQTLLVNRHSGAEFIGPIANFGAFMSAMELNVPKTTLKAGDSLRLDVEAWSYSGGDSNRAWVGHDPQNRTESGAWVTGDSILTFQVPFKLNL